MNLQVGGWAWPGRPNFSLAECGRGLVDLILAWPSVGMARRTRF